jgi:hypothetical protein
MMIKTEKANGSEIGRNRSRGKNSNKEMYRETGRGRSER